MVPSSSVNALTACSGIMNVIKAKPLIFLVRGSTGKLTSVKGPGKLKTERTVSIYIKIMEVYSFWISALILVADLKIIVIDTREQQLHKTLTCAVLWLDQSKKSENTKKNQENHKFPTLLYREGKGNIRKSGKILTNHASACGFPHLCTHCTCSYWFISYMLFWLCGEVEASWASLTADTGVLSISFKTIINLFHHLV